ncbi:TonB-dependent receptor [Bacteroides sp. ET489]|jgi:TonB-linked SusC/RagA family outer membrane protein|uniref:SusC/RagA family TonB-linked outer membrane protein n=1 Tax=Bacteroides TaxID=816 RepID=UPI00033CA78D|nr:MULTISPECIES: TonB-dependent receptor [Bacteroides]MDO3392075.1 TonB-dependent receptor [Bacteroides sp. ET489]CDB09351.1 tonB-dependent Receptor Plug domain-containing protein [Bacteroides sp. CAG:633]
MVMKNVRFSIQKIPYLFLLMLFSCVTAMAQQGITVKGTVFDSTGETVIGASVVVKGNTSIGTISDIDGNFVLTVPSENTTLVVSFVGMKSQEVKATSTNLIKVTLEDDSQQLEEVVVVGYGQQKKASVVGAITQTTGKVLERAAGVSDIGAALTGNLPGVVTTTGTGMPGEEDPKITIRGASSWNNNEDPLVLVDGIERPMSSVDITSVQSISVLKDASATAVYGVKGANGVILITTKRGSEGSAKIDVGFNATLKSPSKLPNKYDSYDALMFRNVAIEHELALTPQSWADIRPQAFIENYRNQTTVEQRERYPNVDWQKALFKDNTMSYNANINISGGTKFVKYFASADYVHEGDLFRVYDNGRGYNSGYGYDRINVRSNLDFNITKTTVLKINLAGSNGIRKAPWTNASQSEWQIGQQWSGVYNIPPDVFLPQYSDGSWGMYPKVSNTTNSVQNISIGGTMQTTSTRINTDFTLEQDLSFITKGLTARATISWDNEFVENNRGINDLNNDSQSKWIDPETGQVVWKNSYDTNQGFDWTQGVNWSTQPGSVDNGQTVRNLYYQAQLSWARSFNRHNLTGMGLFSRQENARGSVMPTYREDWAFRVTYNWADRYFVEYNGAYNGSEKFSPENRFAFFNSGAIGWMISEEPFMRFLREKHILDMMKIRASYGEIGSDQLGDPFDESRRWLYMDSWKYGGHTRIDLNHAESIYTWWYESAIGNENIQWEVVKKLNLGVDYSFLDGLFAGSLEFFRDTRSNIFVFGGDRSIPSYFGGTPPSINKGKIRTTGYELELRVNKMFANGLRLWGNFNMTHARNKVLVKDDQALRPAYQKAAGHSVNQYYSYIDAGFIQNYDQLYGSPIHDSSDSQKLVGDYYIVDYNGDGVIDSKDSVPWGYTSAPENTFNATVGFEWKGFSAFAQFYGVTNVTRDVGLTSLASNLNTVYDTGTWWSKNTPDADVVVPRWNSKPTYYDGTQYLYDGSYIRLKNVEVAYTWTKGWVKKLGIDNLKIYLNGNNLWLWTRMPDDREANLSGAGYLGAYPTVKRYNLGIKFTL